MHCLRQQLSALIVMGLIFYAGPVNAETVEPVAQCAELVKECFSYSNTERTNCFYSSARHPFCEGTSLGTLTYRRWSMSPSKSSGGEAPPAFMGPQLVDAECVANFDNNWSGILLNGEITLKQIDSLDSRLDSCARDISIEISRP